MQLLLLTSGLLADLSIVRSYGEAGKIRESKILGIRMRWLQKLKGFPQFFYVISHERSGTHFLINCIQLNTVTDLKYQSVGEWFGPFEETENQFNHIHKKFKSLNPKNHYILKSHCDRSLFELKYPPGKIVYIFRDYRDVLTSYFHFLKDGYLTWAQKHNPEISCGFPSSFSEFIHSPLSDFLRFNYSTNGDFSTPLERWENHVLNWIQYPSNNIRIVTYNQLSLEPKKTTQQLLDFLNLPQKETFTQPNFKNAYSVMPRKGIVGDWKNQCSPEDLAFLETHLSAQHALTDQFLGNLKPEMAQLHR
ncbi:MAG: sulfotransferase domain-containing protein [Cyanobacteria bacterium P01_F01_bin.86]